MLSANGLRVIVLEARDRIGGRVFTYRDQSYSYVPVNGVEAQLVLSRPVKDTLFFAGEATDTEGHVGTVHGALASGKRAAGEILRSWQDSAKEG